MAQRVSGQVANKLRFYRKTVAAAANTGANARMRLSSTLAADAVDNRLPRATCLAAGSFGGYSA